MCPQVDFLLTAMRQLAAARPDLKLLLMSATVDTQKLVDYMGSAIPGEGPFYSRDQSNVGVVVMVACRTACAALNLLVLNPKQYF